jgi:DNA-binding HxlR family transcriptional regulator
MAPGPRPAPPAVPEGCDRLYADAGVRDVLSRIGGKWTVLVIGLLEAGPVRFNRLRAALPGISQTALTSTLRSLERDGLVRREIALAVPVRVEYSLTGLGVGLSPLLAALRTWTDDHFEDVTASNDSTCPPAT